MLPLGPALAVSGPWGSVHTEAAVTAEKYHLKFFFLGALLFLQSYLVHATQLQRRPSLHIMQNWAGCAWPQRGQLYKGARRLLRKRKEEELTGLHIASPLSERRRIYTTCKAAA